MGGGRSDLADVVERSALTPHGARRPANSKVPPGGHCAKSEENKSASGGALAGGIEGDRHGAGRRRKKTNQHAVKTIGGVGGSDDAGSSSLITFELGDETSPASDATSWSLTLSYSSGFVSF